MRNRIRVLDRSRSASRCVVLLARRARVRGRDEPSRSSPTRRPRSASRSSPKRASTVDDCQKAPSPLHPGHNEIIWGIARVPRAARRHVEVRRARGEEHGEGARGPHPQRPRGRREGHAPRPRRRRRSTSRRSPAPRTRPAASSRRRGRRPSRCARDLIARAEAEATEIRDAGPGRHRDPAQPGDGRAAHRRRVSLSIDLAERIVERNLDRDTQPPARRQLHRPGREQLADGRPHRRLRAGAARHRRGRGPPRRGRGRAVPLRADRRGQRRPAHGARRTRACPLDRRAAIVDELLENRALPIDAAIAAFIVGAGRGHDLPAIVDRFVELAAQTPRARGRRGALGGAARRRAGAAARRRALAGDRQADRGEGRRRRDGPGRDRRHDRRHGDRRHRPSPSRPVEGDASKWQSSPSTRPTSRRSCARTSRASSPTSTASRSAGCSRSATASRASPGLPNAAVNELLEFEGGALGPRAEPRRGHDRRGRARQGRRGRGGPARHRDRPHPLDPGRRRAARPRRERARRRRSTARARSRRTSCAASRCRRPASPAASRCTSRCRPASRPSTR